MSLTFFLDEQDAHAALASFSQIAPNAMLVSSEGTRRWDGVLPTRVGDYFYESPWVLYSSSKNVTPTLDLSMFSADHFKNPKEIASAIQRLEDSVDWSAFSWGGYAKYGMLGLVAPPDIDLGVKPIFHYRSATDFSCSFKGLLGRRTRTQFAPSLWRAINGERVTPLVVTFRYYEEAFEDVDLSFSVEGTFAGDDNEGEVSAYRVHDYATFAYFVGLVNQVYPFDILPGTLSLEACQTARRMARSFDFSSPLHFTPWYLVYNGGEIDTNHALFVAADHSTTLHFGLETGEALSCVMCF